MTSLLMLPPIITVTGLIIVAVCVPLVRGKIGPNLFSGIRTRAAFASDENWYRINKLGGKALLIAGCLMLLAGLAGFLVPADDMGFYAIIAGLVVLGANIWAMTRILRAS